MTKENEAKKETHLKSEHSAGDVRFSAFKTYIPSIF